MPDNNNNMDPFKIWDIGQKGHVTDFKYRKIGKIGF